jgi:hypothetical protein
MNILKNFKSFQYLQNSNYNDLRFVDKKISSSNYGAFCGLSDRTLLNTIFLNIITVVHKGFITKQKMIT